MVNRSKKMSVSSDAEEDQLGSSSDSSEDSIFVPEARNAPGRKRRRGVQDDTESDSDSEETIAAGPRRRRRRSRRGGPAGSEEPEDTNVHRRSRRGRAGPEEPEDTNDPLSVPVDTDAEESDEGRGRGRGRKKRFQTRRNGVVTEAKWTPERTVRITYDIGVKHACMNPVHGKTKNSYKVLHLVNCGWRNNVAMMTGVPSIEKSKSFQYCHKLCEPCLTKYGARCFKCEPEGDSAPVLNTVFGSVVITCVKDFRDSVRKWQQRVDEVGEATYLVLHCTFVGPEASLFRNKFGLRRKTTVHIVYSDVREKMKPAGSGTDLEDSVFQHLWKTIMKEKVHCQNSSMVSFFGNILLNEDLSFNHFNVNDLLLMYEPNIFNDVEEDSFKEFINSLYVHSPPDARAGPSECCLHDAVVHTHREPSSEEDNCTFRHGNLAARIFYKGIKLYFGRKIISEFEQRASLGEALRIGDEGKKLPFHKLYASKGAEVRFRRVANMIQEVARGDPRSLVCSSDTSGFELVCWTQHGNPVGGDFVIPGLMYRFDTSPGCALIFRPTRYYHGTLPTHNRDLKNEKFAAAFSFIPT